jgi:hypothetical protein
LVAAEPDICANRHGGNAQSEAAHDNSARSAGRQRDWCLGQIRKAGAFGRTCDELSESASASTGKDVSPNRISGRLTELKVAGLIIQSELYPTRRTRAGASASVWVVPGCERARPREAWHPRPGRVSADQQPLLFGEREYGERL